MAAEAHPPTHVLAELAEGALDDAQSREVQAHVDQCDACQSVIDQLAQVTATLRNAPGEIAMPELVSARISAALAAEYAGTARAAQATPPAAAADADGTVAWFRRRMPQALAAAASVAVIGLAGYIATTSNTGGGGDDLAAESAGDSAEAATDQDETTRMGPRTGTVTPQQEDGSDPGAGMNEPSAMYERHIDEAELTAAVARVEQDRSRVSNSCGQVLADELDLSLVGSENVGAGVLVVLDEGDTLGGWLLSTCNSGSNETLEPQVEVPKSE